MAIVTPPPRISSLYRAMSPTSLAFPTMSAAQGWNPVPYSPGPVPSFVSNYLSGNGGGGAGAPAAGAGSTPVVAAPSTAGLGFNIGDYGDDPIVGKVRSAVNAQTKEAEANALAQRKAQLIRFGDPSMAASILGNDAGDAVTAAKDNPFSTIHDLDVWNQRSLTGIDETRNQQNLFYSTTRARDRALQEESMLRGKATASAQLQDVLNGISQDVINVRNQGLQQIIAAEEAAYNRAMERALAEAQMQAAAAQSSGGYPSGGGGTVVVDGGGSPVNTYLPGATTHPLDGAVVAPQYTPTRTSGLAEGIGF